MGYYKRMEEEMRAQMEQEKRDLKRIERQIRQIELAERVPPAQIGYKEMLPTYAEAREYAKALAYAQTMPVIQVPGSPEPIEVYTMGKQNPMVLNAGASFTPYVLDHDVYQRYVADCEQMRDQLRRYDNILSDSHFELRKAKPGSPLYDTLWETINRVTLKRAELEKLLKEKEAASPIKARVMTEAEDVDGYNAGYTAGKKLPDVPKRPKFISEHNKRAPEPTYTKAQFDAEVRKQTNARQQEWKVRQERKALMDKAREDKELADLPWCIRTGRNQLDEQAPWYTVNEDGEPTVLFFGDKRHIYVPDRSEELRRMREFKEVGFPKASGWANSNPPPPPPAGENPGKRQHPARVRRPKAQGRKAQTPALELGSSQCYRCYEYLANDSYCYTCKQYDRPKLTQAGYH